MYKVLAIKESAKSPGATLEAELNDGWSIDETFSAGKVGIVVLKKK